MNERYKDEEFVPFAEVAAGIKAENDLAAVMLRVSQGLRGLYSTLESLSKHDSSFSMGTTQVGDHELTGYVLPWSDESTGAQKLAIYRANGTEHYIVQFSAGCKAGEDPERTSKFVVDFREGIYFGQVRRPNTDVDSTGLWYELDEILVSAS